MKHYDAMISGQAPGVFHIIILNDNLEKAYSELREFISKNVEDKEQGLCLAKLFKTIKLK